MTTTNDPAPLSGSERLRYARHLTLPNVGVEGQQRLRAARVLIVGAGGLGSPAALYLAAAGVGTLGLVDFDVVDESNLQRQLLHATADVGRTKLDSARDRLHGVNPHVTVMPHPVRLSSANALAIIGAYDMVLDGSDNFATRYLVSDACVLTGRPNVHGAVFRFEGQASVFSTPGGPCYRCLFPEPPPPGSVPSCAEGGVLGVLPGLIGTIQATEALKLVLDIGRSLAGRLLLVDALTMEYRMMDIPRDPDCPSCGTRTITALIDYEQFCGVCDTVPAAGGADITPRELAARLREGSVTLIDVREPHEWDIARIEGARLIPLGQLGGALHELDRHDDIVVMCRSGQRSASAARQLEAAGFQRVRNLTGGILRWSDDVDPKVPRY